MTKKDALAVALRVLGAYVLLEAVQSLQWLIMFLFQVARSARSTPSAAAALVGILVPVAALIAAGVLLLRRGDRVAAHLVTDEPAPASTASGLNVRDLQVVAFSVVGLCVFLAALPKFCPMALSLFYAHTTALPFDRSRFLRQQAGAFCAAMLQALLGVVVFLQARGLSNLWHRVQAGRYEKRPEPEV